MFKKELDRYFENNKNISKQKYEQIKQENSMRETAAYQHLHNVKKKKAKK